MDETYAKELQVRIILPNIGYDYKIINSVRFQKLIILGDL